MAAFYSDQNLASKLFSLLGLSSAQDPSLDASAFLSFLGNFCLCVEVCADMRINKNFGRLVFFRIVLIIFSKGFNTIQSELKV